MNENNFEIKYHRTLIAKEIELGFLYINAETRKYFPKKTEHIRIALDDSKKYQEYQYNATYTRIFGLSKWYRKHGFQAKSQLEFLFEEEGIRLRSVDQGTGKTTEYSADELEHIVDLSGLSTMAKGDIVEDRIKEIILLYGQGELSVYKPVSDNEGIDLIVVKNGIFQPLFLQVKGRFKLRGKNILCDVRLKTFKPHHSYFVVAAYFDPTTLDIHDRILFAPSKVVEREGILVNKGKDERRRIVTNIINPQKDKWVKYSMTKQDFVNEIFKKFSEMGKYLK
jgi:hypothetical protein